jgi:hypothetical protein
MPFDVKAFDGNGGGESGFRELVAGDRYAGM